ncbi:MAG: hypothetical protein QOH73_1370 [Gaiellaceae bacterium]|nr:hypothetical protein [Gaiellaceae bacterium]
MSELGVDRMERALERRLREVTGAAPVTERELRTLAEKGDAWARTLEGLVAASERRLGALGADPQSSLATFAEEIARAERLRRERDELQILLRELDTRARTLRTSWLAHQASSGRAG